MQLKKNQTKNGKTNCEREREREREREVTFFVWENYA